MIPLIILGVIVSIPYGVYRAVEKWGISVLWFLAAAVSFLGFTGVVAENLWGPQWAWNLGHHWEPNRWHTQPGRPDRLLIFLVRGARCLAIWPGMPLTETRRYMWRRLIGDAK